MIENAGVPGHNRQQTVIASGAHVATETIALKNLCNNGIQVTLNVTVKTSTPTNIVLSIYGKDPTSGTRYLLLAGAAVTDVTATPLVYKVFPGAPVTTNVSANDIVPLDIEIEVVPTGGDADNYFTYSVGIQYTI